MLNGIFNKIGDLLFLPIAGLHPVLIILVLSVLIAAGSLIIFRWTSDQTKIKAAKARMKAHLVGVALFRHDLRQVFRSLGLSLWASLSNLRFMLIPLGVMIVPLGLLFIQFEMRLGMKGLEPGQKTILRVMAKEGTALDGIEIEVPEGVVVETPGVRVLDKLAKLREVNFRLRAVSEGDHEIKVRSGTSETTKRMTVADGFPLLSPIRPGGSFFDSVLYPAEPPLDPESPFTSIELSYPVAMYAFLGIDWAWWLLFLVFMILALFALKGPLGVDF